MIVFETCSETFPARSIVLKCNVWLPSASSEYSLGLVQLLQGSISLPHSYEEFSSLLENVYETVETFIFPSGPFTEIMGCVRSISQSYVAVPMLPASSCE